MACVVAIAVPSVKLIALMNVLSLSLSLPFSHHDFSSASPIMRFAQPYSNVTCLSYTTLETKVFVCLSSCAGALASVHADASYVFSPHPSTASETCLLHISTENAEPDATGPLRLDVVHTPSLPTVDMESGDCRRWQPVALDIGHLCVESLAQHAIEIRIASRLHSLYKYLVQFPLYRDRVHFQADSLQLVISFNDGSSEGDALLIFVDSQAGSYRARLLPSDPFNVLNFLEIVQLLNKPFTLDLIKRLDRLRARVVLQHCRRQMESRGWSVYSRLPMSPVVTALSKLGPDYILIKLAKQQSAGYLVSLVLPLV